MAQDKEVREEAYGLVYFIGNRESGPVKIGFTSNADPKPRLRQLQTSSPLDLEVIGAVKAYASIERNIQSFLTPHRIRGEWFERQAALAILRRLKSRDVSHRSDFVDELLSIAHNNYSSPGAEYGEACDDSLHAQIARALIRDVVCQLRGVNTADPLPFRAWLLAQAGRDDTTGDLARDVALHPEFPPIASLPDYLACLGPVSSSNPAVVRAVIEAWIQCDSDVCGLTTRPADTFVWPGIAIASQ